MSIRKIKKSVYSVGVVDWDRRLFDELITLPFGTSYNAYLVCGEQKNVLIDTVEPIKKDEFFDNLMALNISNIDYVIVNHAEQDHSGALPYLLELYPGLKVVTNKKCKELLRDLLQIDSERVMEVKDGDVLSLGDKHFQFIFTPWAHWPETMCTYLVEDKILFSCDLFGSHKATSEVFVSNSVENLKEAKRYFAEIMMPFRVQIAKHIEKLLSYEINIIAPSHGPVYKQEDVDFIVEAYKHWCSNEMNSKVLIPFVSMHNSSRKIVNYIVDYFTERNHQVLPINLVYSDLGELAVEAIEASGLIFVFPYVLSGPHPVIVNAAYFLNLLRPKFRAVGLIASYGWGGKGIEYLKSLLINVKGQFLDPILIKGCPVSEDFRAIDALLDTYIGIENSID